MRRERERRRDGRSVENAPFGVSTPPMSPMTMIRVGAIEGHSRRRAGPYYGMARFVRGIGVTVVAPGLPSPRPRLFVEFPGFRRDAGRLDAREASTQRQVCDQEVTTVEQLPCLRRPARACDIPGWLSWAGGVDTSSTVRDSGGRGASVNPQGAILAGAESESSPVGSGVISSLRAREVRVGHEFHRERFRRTRSISLMLRHCSSGCHRRPTQTTCRAVPRRGTRCTRH